MRVLVVLPPQTPPTWEGARRLATAVSELSVVASENETEAQRIVGSAT